MSMGTTYSVILYLINEEDYLPDSTRLLQQLVETQVGVHPLDACDGIHAEDNELCLSCQVKTAMIRICNKIRVQIKTPCLIC
jgi:hypothetical protein